MITFQPSTPMIQDALLELAFDLYRINKELHRLYAALPLRGEVADHALDHGPTVEFRIDGAILHVIDELEELAVRLITASQHTEVELRKEDLHRRSREKENGGMLKSQ